MQMYHVSFVTTYSDRKDAGKVLVCANDYEHAQLLVLTALELPTSKTTMEVSRVKPNLYQLSRKEYEKEKLAALPAFVSGKKDGSESRSNDDNVMRKHTLSVKAEVIAGNEANAWRKLAGAVTAKASSEKMPVAKSIVDLMMHCDGDPVYHPKPPAIEKQAIYTHHQFFAGGAARPR